MKKLMMCLAALGVSLFVGCTPTAEEIKATATAVGTAAGLVANQTKISDDARNAVVTILGEVRACVPADGQTFEQAWKPVIDSKVAELIAAGKLNDTTGALVKTVANMAAQAVDYFFDKYPKAKKSEELVRAGVSGALDGFLTVFKPVNHAEDDCPDCVARGKAKTNYDKEAYEFFQKKFAK